jgi:hypothetical protein
MAETFDFTADLLTRWARVPAAKRPEVLLGALKTVAQGAEWRPLWSIAKRESAANYMVEHRLPADAQGATKVWERLKDTTYRDNPQRDPALWSVGRGPWGMMTPYYVSRWDALADPRILHHPFVASVVALRTVASIVASGARTWTQVNEAWASGKWDRDSEGARDRARRFRERLERDGYGHLADAAPIVLPAGWGRGEQPGQDARLAELVSAFERGMDSLPPLPPPDPRTAPATLTTWLGLGMVVAGLGTWMVYRARSLPR